MSSVLFVHASPHGRDSRGYRLAKEAISNVLATEPAGELIERDVTALPQSTLTRGYAEAIVGRLGPEAEAFAQSEQLIGELERTDCLVIATPMHNYTVPAALKLWIDKVLRIGRSFAPQGGRKLGLLRDRPTLVVVTAGGFVTGEAALQPDHLSGYLRDVLATLGIRDLRFVYLEGMVRPDLAESMVESGRQAIAVDRAFGPSLAVRGAEG